MRKPQWLHSWDLGIALIVTVAVGILMLNYNLIATHDGFIHLKWVYYWHQHFLQGQFNPKWFDEAFGGLGTTSFIFYPPLFRWLSLPFAGFNLLPSQLLKACFILVLIINTVGVVKLCRLLFPKNSLASFATIILGVFNPYLMICLFKRGAAAETLAIALIPWLMIGIFIALKTPKIIGIFPITLAFSALFIAHIPSCVIIVSAYLISLFILLLLRKITWKKTLILFVIPLGLAFLIDAFYLFPVIFDRHLIQGMPPAANGDQFYYDGFLVNDILKLRFLPSPREFEKSLLTLFVLNSIILGLALFTRPWQGKQPKQILLTQQVIMMAFCLFMMTDLSQFISHHFSIFIQLQYPWRFLTLTTALSPYLFGYSLEFFANQYPWFRKQSIRFIIGTILLLILYKSVNHYSLLLNRPPQKTLDNLVTHTTEINLNLINQLKHEKIGNFYAIKLSHAKLYLNRDFKVIQADVPEYLPASSNSQNWLPKTENLVEITQGEGQVSQINWQSGHRSFKFQAISNATVTLRTFYYPGWKINITPSPKQREQLILISSATDGRIRLQLPPGMYEIKLWYQGTLAERLGIVVSLSMIVILSLLWLIMRNREPKIMNS